MLLQAVNPLATKVIKKTNKTSSHIVNENLTKAFKNLFEEFKKVPEIGKFKEIKVKIHEPLKDCSINDSFLILRPLADKNDFRTRVLSYGAVSPLDSSITREIGYISGNKIAMDSALKDKARISEFKSFLKESEKFFAYAE